MGGYNNYNYQPVVSNPIMNYQQQMGGNGGGAVGITEPTTGPGMTAPGMTQAATPLGMNIGTGQLALGAIGTIGNLWAAWQAQKLAKEQFNFQKGVTNQGIAQEIQGYNTQLSGRAENRGFLAGDSAEKTAQYINTNKFVDQRPVI